MKIIYAHLSRKSAFAIADYLTQTTKQWLLLIAYYH